MGSLEGKKRLTEQIHGLSQRTWVNLERRLVNFDVSPPRPRKMYIHASVLNRPGGLIGRLRPGLGAKVRAGLKQPGAAPAILRHGLNSPGLAQAGPGYSGHAPDYAGHAPDYAGHAPDYAGRSRLCRPVQAIQAADPSWHSIYNCCFPPQVFTRKNSKLDSANVISNQ